MNKELPEQYGDDSDDMYSVNTDDIDVKAPVDNASLPKLDKKGIVTDITISGVKFTVVDPNYILRLQHTINMQSKKIEELTNKNNTLRFAIDRANTEINNIKRIISKFDQY